MENDGPIVFISHFQSLRQAAVSASVPLTTEPRYLSGFLRLRDAP